MGLADGGCGFAIGFGFVKGRAVVVFAVVGVEVVGAGAGWGSKTMVMQWRGLRQEERFVESCGVFEIEIKAFFRRSGR